MNQWSNSLRKPLSSSWKNHASNYRRNPWRTFRKNPSKNFSGNLWSSSYRHSCKTWVFSITHAKGGRYDSRSMQEPFVMKNSLTSLGIEHLRACHMIYTHMQNGNWRRKLTVNNCTGWVRLKYIDFGMLTFSVLGKSKRLVLLFPTFRPFYSDFFKGLTVNRSSLHKVLPDFWEGASCIQFCTLILQFWDTGTLWWLSTTYTTIDDRHNY